MKVPQKTAPSRSLALACFSPLIMMLTFSFEFLAALFILVRYRLDKRAGLLIAILLNLGLFQIAEWSICANSGAQVWARIGFIGTALLIPLGLGYLQELSPSRAGNLATRLAWVSALGFIAWFIFVPNSVSFVFCGGNYSIYRLTLVLSYAYSAFYWGWLAFSVWLAVRQGRRKQSAENRRALYGTALGYVAFMAPTLISNALNPETLHAIPSILCGFAIFYAVIIVTVVAPASLQRRS